LLSKRNERIKACFPIALTVLIVRWTFYNLLRSVTIIRRVSLLPQRIFCSKCSEPLYAGLELETPVEVIQRNGGYCPKCGKKLSFEVENLKINQATSRLGPGPS